MKKLFYILPLLVLNTLTSKGQTTATDFTATDCGGTSHHLFADLDAGKIVVISFVMPCGSCVSPTASANSTVNSYASTHPGKVVFYKSDDVANTPCASLTSWVSTNGFSGITTFSTSSVKATDYGAVAMPKIVAMAGSDHKVIYKEDDALNASALQTAINTALTNATLSVAQKQEDKVNMLSISPNPVTRNFEISYTLANAGAVTLDIYNVAGAKVKTIANGQQQQGKHTIAVDLDGKLSNGSYFLKMNAGTTSSTVQFTIAN